MTRCYYDDNRLRRHVARLIERLMATVALDKQGLITEEITVIEESNPHEEDCYDSIGIEYEKGSERLYETKIDIGNYGMISRFHFVGELNDERLHEKLFEEFITVLQEQRLADI